MQLDMAVVACMHMCVNAGECTRISRVCAVSGLVSEWHSDVDATLSSGVLCMQHAACPCASRCCTTYCILAAMIGFSCSCYHYSISDPRSRPPLLLKSLVKGDNTSTLGPLHEPCFEHAVRFSANKYDEIVLVSHLVVSVLGFVNCAMAPCHMIDTSALTQLQTSYMLLALERQVTSEARLCMLCWNASLTSRSSRLFATTKKPRLFQTSSKLYELSSATSKT
jgi:hypothetical protein